VLFAVLLAVSFWPSGASPAGMFHAFYRSGALVFGGGHVVLPLLSEAVVEPGWVSHEYFLAGYGAAQAVPGPLFTFGAYLGAASTNPVGGLAGAAIALVAIFLPGMLLQLAALPFWSAIRGRHSMQSCEVSTLLSSACSRLRSISPSGPAQCSAASISRSPSRVSFCSRCGRRRRWWSSD
jgi:hypothetical protein